MHGQRAMKAHTAGRRCGHPYCEDCPTKRGRNRGVRRERRAIKVALVATRKGRFAA